MVKREKTAVSLQKMQEIEQKIHFLSIGNHARKRLKENYNCVNDTQFDNWQTTSELIIILGWELGPKDVIQVDLLPERPPSGDYEIIITTIVVFS